MNKTNIKAGILGASGYTGAEMIRLLDRHPLADLVSLGANTQAGQSAREVFPHLPVGLPDMVAMDEMPLDRLDVLFLGLPHKASAMIIAELLPKYPHLRLIDLSADFRLDDKATYAEAYGEEHPVPELLHQGVYGLSEHYRDQIVKARLVACPGCYCTTVQLGLVPLLKAGVIETNDIIIDAKSGLSGAGKGVKASLMFSELHQGMSAYSIGNHRHLWEIEQELSKAAGAGLNVSFTPLLVPINRGILATSYVKMAQGQTVNDLRQSLVDFYCDDIFIRVLAQGDLPKTQQVFGSNSAILAVEADRLSGRAIVFSVLDNMQKGASGQAVQNMNIMFNLPEGAGLEHIALYP